VGGHSHWATTKRHKAVVDAKRGKAFSKIIREITIAARLGGGDSDTNPRLRLVISKAKDANMPADNIKKAIQRGTGEIPGVAYEETILEGYGPNGIALLLEVATDNRNRTVADIRHIFSKYGGALAEAGAVSWQFEKKGCIVTARSKVDEETLMTVALAAGADDVRAEDDTYTVLTAPTNFEAVKQAITDHQIAIEHAEVTSIPSNTITIEEKPAEQVLRLIDKIEDNDDVQKVHANYDIPHEIMEKFAASA
tara:strand:+ start:5319 stop:6074 length:756 start_codon:yes stop_codon:yes gene_type:complete